MNNYLKNRKKFLGVSNLIALPTKTAICVWKKFLPSNPVHLGNCDVLKDTEKSPTEKIESELISKMVALYGGESEVTTGYCTTGATEGNIFSAWLGRKWFEKRDIPLFQQCVLQTSLSHFSVPKAADIVGLKSHIIGIEKKTWNMSRESLKNKVDILIKKGFKGFLVPLTVGYTLTGTDDDFEKIIGVINELKKKHKGIYFFCWIDAALSGLIKPFIDEGFLPLKYPEIKTFIVDFHKFGGVPCPAGLILYQKDLKKLVEKNVDYLNKSDSTLLSARSGIIPAVCLAIFENYGKSGFLKKIKRNLRKKEKFLKECSKKNGVKIITTKNSLNLGIVLKKNKEENQRYFSKKYNLYFKEVKLNFLNKKEKFLMSKAFFIND